MAAEAPTEGGWDARKDYADSDSNKAMLGMPAEPAPPPPPPPPGQAPTANTSPASAAPSKQMLVYTADFTLSVYQVEPGLERVQALATELGGYLASRNDHEIVIRVPRDRFSTALAEIEKVGEVVHRDVRAIDVTDEFVDTASRLQNAKKMRDRLQELLTRAQVKDALEIEKELGRITEQIEVLEGKFKLLSDRIAFSTITVRYAAKGPVAQRADSRLPFAWLKRLGVNRLLVLDAGRTYQ